MGRELTPEELDQYHEDGYVVVYGLVDWEVMGQVKQTILDFVDDPGDHANVLDQEMAVRQGAGDDLEHRAKYRKLNQLGRHRDVVWNNWYAHPNVLSILRQFLGDDILVKYDAVFLKPAKTGGETPWHQDIGLWRDEHVEAANGWIAVDAATVENGCMQFVPGSHKDGYVQHVVYDDSLHGEIPRRMTTDLNAVDVELDSGDAVFWHSYMWHYSPLNTSDHSRIGMGAVWASLEQAEVSQRVKQYLWVMRNAERLTFPPEAFVIEDGERVQAPPFPRGN